MASEEATDADPAVAAASVLDLVEERLGAVDDVLRRLDDGSYGTCARCGTALGAARLDEDPLARSCAPTCRS